MTNQYHNIHDELLADTLGDLDAKIKALQAEAKLVKTELKDRGVGTIVGERFQVNVSEATRCTLDQKALVEALGDEALDPFRAFATVTTVKVTVRKEKLAAAA
jgi:hypothetical protein